LRRYLEAVALNTAGVVTDETLIRASGVDRKTAVAYERLLTNLLLLEQVPAWSTNRLNRLTKRPKRFLVDPSLLGAVLGATRVGVLADGDLLGRLLKTFVLAQIRAEIPVSDLRPRLFHFRQDDGRREVDLLAELGAERVVAIEVKATSSPTAADARHLIWLRDQYEDRFVVGAVLHTGPKAFALSDRIYAVPICALWGAPT
jgi:predicted AAA+ superfamily ATPase